MTMDDHPPRTPTPQIIPCIGCGYNMFGLSVGQHCPECGRPVMLGASNYATSGKAIASMVLGILSIIGCVAYGLPGVILGGLAVIFARLARKDIVAGRVSPTSQGFATAGFVCGLIGLILGGIFLAAMGLVVFSMMQP
ncbi:MAG: hypothetical protein ACI89L_000791 [Phycisphaerales bacterium]|jgi:hypothetical protein